MNGKSLRIIWWIVKEGEKKHLLTTHNEKPFPWIKKEFSKLVFHDLAQEFATFECEYGPV